MKLPLIILINFMAIFAFSQELPVVIVETNRGNFEIELYPDKAPASVENFLKYVDAKFYDGTIIHRVVKNFVIQAGGLNQDLSEKPTETPIKNEAHNGLSNLKGMVAMARTDEIDSATSHFFVNLKDNVRLDYVDPSHFGYAVFGKVIKGYEIVEDIEKQTVQTVGDYSDVPVNPIVMTSVHRK